MLRGLESKITTKPTRLSAAFAREEKENSTRQGVNASKIASLGKKGAAHSGNGKKDSNQDNFGETILHSKPQQNLNPKKGAKRTVNANLKDVQDGLVIKKSKFSARVSTVPECDLRMMFCPKNDKVSSQKPRSVSKKKTRSLLHLLDDKIDIPELPSGRLLLKKTSKPKVQDSHVKPFALRLSPLPNDILSLSVECAPSVSYEIDETTKLNKLDHKSIFEKPWFPCESYGVSNLNLSDSDLSSEDFPPTRDRISDYLPKRGISDIDDSLSSFIKNGDPLPFRELFSSA